MTNRRNFIKQMATVGIVSNIPGVLSSQNKFSQNKSLMSLNNDTENLDMTNDLPFEVGVSMVDITPPVGFPLYGYPSKPSTGIKDPLYAKAIVFKQGKTKGALVICNLLGIPRDLSRIVRERAQNETGIPFQNISISATHTHTSPGITESFKEYALRESANKLTDEDKKGYFTKLINGVTTSIISANSNTSKVEITSGIGQAPGISFNRRYLMTDGRVRFNPGRNNPNIVRPSGPVDPDVSFVLFRKQGQNRYSSSLTVFSSHYVRDATEFSSDYPHFIQQRFNELFGNQHVSVFGLGPCGNINTVNAMNASTENADVKVKKFGYILADAVNNVLPKEINRNPSLEIVSKIIYLPIQDYTKEELEWSGEEGEQLYNERSFLNHRRRLKISIWGVQPPLEKLRMYEAVAPAVSGDVWYLPVEIHVFKLDQETAIVTMPSELFVEFGIDIKKRSPFANTMLIELANADIAYLPTIQGFKEGDYEAINSRLIPGSGEKMIDSAIEILESLKKQ
ncbi:MAG: neutral/alkaline non-lysosomal ceramidase N-terminal domain-containing protein [Dysgonamonadaceae bacterium]|nr:neutral/alkaline non-lysosomal ceramidase N-terminal domain-containing protein [Dysgonamonadaceae bacterium]MDD4727788.1 neutral/alkaline non-lysosomal ceramidase N-terminal domain-containing protein [Dysgonamonadaceae bacterium]